MLSAEKLILLAVKVGDGHSFEGDSFWFGSDNEDEGDFNDKETRTEKRTAWRERSSPALPKDSLDSSLLQNRRARLTATRGKYTCNSTADIAEVTITVNGYVDMTATKIDLVNKGCAP